jgi:hypothetical protein
MTGLSRWCFFSTRWMAFGFARGFLLIDSSGSVVDETKTKIRKLETARTGIA